MVSHERFSWDHVALNSRALYLMSAIFTIVGLFAFLIVLCLPNGRDYLTAVTVIFASVAALLAAAVKFQAEERDRAFKFLTENTNSKELIASLGFVGRVITKNEIFDESVAVAVYTSRDPRDKEFLAHVTNVYNFFEEMAIAIKNKQVNERIIKQFYAGPLCRFGDFTKVLLPIIRNHPEIIPEHPWGEKKRPDAFVYAEWLHERWTPYYMSYFAGPEPQREGYPSSVWTGRADH